LEIDSYYISKDTMRFILMLCNFLLDNLVLGHLLHLFVTRIETPSYLKDGVEVLRDVKGRFKPPLQR